MQKMKFEFVRGVNMNEVALTLVLARISAEGIVGAARVRLEVQHELDRVGKAFVVRGAGEAFDAVVRIFTSLLNREFGDAAFTVQPSRPVETAA